MSTRLILILFFRKIQIYTVSARNIGRSIYWDFFFLRPCSRYFGNGFLRFRALYRFQACRNLACIVFGFPIFKMILLIDDKIYWKKLITVVSIKYIPYFLKNNFEVFHATTYDYFRLNHFYFLDFKILHFSTFFWNQKILFLIM